MTINKANDHSKYANWINPNDVTPYERNAKQHNDKQVRNIVNSIKRFGWQQDTVITSDHVLVIGHGRRLAALKLGCMMPYHMIDKTADELTDEDIRELRIADNQTNAETGFDFDIMTAEIEDLSFEGFEFDFDVESGGGTTKFDIVEDEAPEVQETAIAKLGDIWQLGRHRLMCGDSTIENNVLNLMGGAKAQMVFTDPPWNVSYGQENERWKQRSILNDSMSTEDFKEFMYGAFKCMNAASEQGAMTYVVMSAQEWGNMMLALADNDYHWSSTIIWNKDQLVLSRKDYHTKYEPIWYGWKNGEARLHPLEDRKQCDVWDFDRPKVSEEHPTMKPVGLVARAIQNSSNIDDIILDLFGGSGTTLIAAEQTERVCYMMELDPKYVDVIIKRWETFTGEKAVLLNG